MSAERPRSRPQSAGWRLVDLVVSLAALALGAPGSLGLALGWPLADWPIPLRPQLGGEIALKTVVYLSGFLASYGAIGLAWRLWSGDGGGALPAPPLTRGQGRGAEDAADVRASGGDTGANADDGPLSLVEPLYGFLPCDVQLRLARETGYQALLYSRISTLMTSAVGVLLAGAWDPPSPTAPIPPDAALRIGVGLYLMAESVRRYIAFARGEPAGTLVGTLIHGALSPLWRRWRSPD